MFSALFTHLFLLLCPFSRKNHTVSSSFLDTCPGLDRLSTDVQKVSPEPFSQHVAEILHRTVSSPLFRCLVVWSVAYVRCMRCMSVTCKFISFVSHSLCVTQLVHQLRLCYMSWLLCVVVLPVLYIKYDCATYLVYDVFVVGVVFNVCATWHVCQMWLCYVGCLFNVVVLYGLCI